MFYLGIDVGSVSTDFVVIDEDNNVVKDVYLKTGGNPINAIKEGMSVIGRDFEDRDISGVGTTGSGRQLAGIMVGADVVKNEITAHGRATATLHPQVRTIFEIGGQDSKIILLKNGYVTDFAMNTVCAAGTGSFLDRQAERIGVKTSQIGDMALKAENATPIAGRCAVFAESDIIHRQQMGVPLENIMRGMCRALVRNYMSNVAKGKKLEPGYCFQGGVSCNQGIKRAFEEEIGENIIVPQYNKVMGAIGAAIISKEATRNKASSFKGFHAVSLGTRTEEFVCEGCANNCEVVRLMCKDEQIGCFQDKCGRYQTEGLYT